MKPYSVQISNEILAYFLADPIGPLLNLEHVAADKKNPISLKINKQLELFDTTTIDKIKEDEQFLFFWGKSEGSELDYRARLWGLKKKLCEIIPAIRLQKNADGMQLERPLPYQDTAVSDLQLTSDHLVPLNLFQVQSNALIRNGTIFTVFPPVESINSQYWLLKSLISHGLKDVDFVRLDPFLIQLEKDYPYMEYRMWCYGIPLDWNRIENLKNEEHGRWWPEYSSANWAYTDYSWTPRNDEIHFLCEELPAKEDILSRGSRYFHAIYLPAKKRITHLDGAIRIYSASEWDKRHASHVRHSGKIGKRIKVFRIDREVSRECLNDLCANYFVWNQDVANYFS